MVLKYHRVWSLILAMIMLGSCVLSPLSIRVSATAQDDPALPAQVSDIPGESEELPGEASIEEPEEAPSGDAGNEPSGDPEEASPGEAEESPSEDTGEAAPGETGDTSSEDTGEAAPGETGDTSSEDTDEAAPGETEDTSSEDTGEAAPGETEEDPDGEAGEASSEEIDEIAEEAPVSLEPDYTGHPVIPGMKEHMQTLPAKDYKGVSPGVTFLAYLDLELFEGIEVDHINVLFNSVLNGNENPYLTVYVVNNVTAAIEGEYPLYPRAEELGSLTSGQVLSLYPSEGVTIRVGQGQTLGFGKNGDPLVCSFQNDNSQTPPALLGFYMNRGFTSGTSGGSLCVDVYAKEEPQTSDRDAALIQALAGKKLSILGDSISTYYGWSNSTAANSTLGSNQVWYSDSNKKPPFSVLQTWWKQAVDRYGMELLVNNSWSGSTVATSSGSPESSFGWNTRPVQLHSSDGVNPDIIAIYMGTNDLIQGIPCDPAALTDELYAAIQAPDYTPGNLQEAAALMVYKVRTTYSQAEIFLFSNPAMSGGDGYRAAYNQVLEALAERYDCTLVDLHSSAIRNYAAYTIDGTHPNSAGMDVMTESFAEALYGKYVEHTHVPVSIPGVEPTYSAPGLTEGAKCAACGAILTPQEEIPMLIFAPRLFRWELNGDGSELVSRNTGIFTDNPPSLESGTIAGGAFSGVRLALTEAPQLRHDQPWAIEWRSTGTWAVDNLLFSAENTSAASGNIYLYRHRNHISIGTYSGGYKNYGVSLPSDYTTAAEHTFRLVNRVSSSGSMVYLYVDGLEIGPLNRMNGTGQISDWLSGKDLQFRYIGAQGDFRVSGSGLQYLLVSEGLDHDHTLEPIPGTEATLEQTGMTEGQRCADCGKILVPREVIPSLRESSMLEALSGKKLSILGDGISTYADATMEGNAVWYDSTKLASVDDTWWKQAADLYGMEILVNNAWSGSSVTSIRSEHGESSYGWNIRPSQLGADPDIIAIYMGANDLAADAACDPSRLTNAFFAKLQAGGYAPETGNLEEAAALMVHKVITAYPGAQVFLFNQPAMGQGTAAGRTAYNKALRIIASRYGCVLVDLSGSSMSSYSTYTQDGVHPNAAGMDVMTQVFSDALYERYVAPSAATERGVYLSDLPYIPSGTSVSSTGYKKDNSPSGDQIQLRVDGSVVTYDKGIGAHAPSTVTFDISRYIGDYPRFCAKLGVDARQNAKGSVSFTLLGSNALTGVGDHTGWDVLLTTETLTAASTAVEVDLDVSAYKYLRLYADHLGGNGNDHSVYADARLVEKDYDLDAEYFSLLHPLEWYDAELSRHDYADNLENRQKLILEREFVLRLGHANIQSQVKYHDTMADTLTWLLNDPSALRLFIEAGGNIRSAANTLINLDTLYTRYKDILSDSGSGYIYKKMLIALAVAWSNDAIRSPYNFNRVKLDISITERFEAARWVYDQGYMHYGQDMYASYNMELMRALVADYIGYDEVRWVQHFAAEKYPDTPAAWTGPYRFMGYVNPPYYGHEEYYSPDTWPSYDAKYHLTPYSILRSEKDSPVYRLWMVYEAGGICWNISRLGQTLNRSFGIPTAGTFQPGHEAYFFYSEDANGQGLWNIGNNVGGWVRAYTSWSSVTYRLPLGWGSDTAYARTTNNSSSYILLAQGALNRYPELQESMYLNMLADAYADPAQKAAVYQASLDALELNLDTYLDLIDLYKSQPDAVTPEKWRRLAMDIIDAYTYYPVPMVDLLTAIEPYLGSYSPSVSSAKIAALNKAKAATAEDSLQYSACSILAASMLGQSTDDVLATFSFDGEHAGAIVLGQSYADYAFQLQYSLNGGEQWEVFTKDTANTSRIIPLTEEQLASINAEDDILLFISGMPVEGEDDGSGEAPAPDYFRIDILEGAAPVVNTANAAAQISIHDGENWIVGKTHALEYSLDNGAVWNRYDPETTRFAGNQTLLVRYAAHGTSLLGPSISLSFTDTNESSTFRHIPVSEVTLVRDNGTTYYQGRTGDLALDANPFTGWHSDDNQLAENKQIVVEFAEVKQLAGLTYKSAGHNGRFLGVEIFVSMDDVTWIPVGSASGWANNDTMKTVKLANSVPAKYVKLMATTNNLYICAQDIDFFEDPTVEVHAASIHYSTTTPTQDNVTASLVLDSSFTPVGDTRHVFEENGRHSFAYTDAAGVAHTITAEVTWIDREAPTAEISFSTTEVTSDPVTVTIIPSEEVTVTSGDGTLSHTFTGNGEYTFVLVDAAGNTAAIPVTVDWIRPVSKAASFSFDGENAGKLVLDVFYAGKPVCVTYSLDGAAETTVWLTADSPKVIPLTPEQLAGLSASADAEGEIRVSVTVSGDETAAGSAVIDLSAAPAAPVIGTDSASSQIAIHDGENWIRGNTAHLEYSTDGIHWTACTEDLRFPGAQKLRVRYAGRGLTRPSAVRELTFTDSAADYAYIHTENISLVSASGEAFWSGNKGEYALDGDPFTYWHSASGSPREITVEFDQARYLAGFAYARDGRNGRAQAVEIQISLDNRHWFTAGSTSGWAHTSTRKELKLMEPVAAKFVKLVFTQTYGNSNGEANRYISANTLDFYEDTTREPPSEATQIHYSTTDPTNQDVTAYLLLGPGCEAEVTEHTFTENGTCPFLYTNAQGETGSVTATVDWIDKTPPTATVTYDPATVTDGPVTATIHPDENVTVWNTVYAVPYYVFEANGEFTFEMLDRAGNIGYVTATVDWIIPDDGELVCFSFSGEDAGKLVLAPFFTDRAVSVSYSVCGGEAKTVELSAEADKRITLTADELNALYTGPDGSDELTVTITSALEGGFARSQTFNIVNGTTPEAFSSGSPNAATQIAIHDGENWITGNTDNLEYSTDGGRTWTAYVHGVTRFPGDQTVTVRPAARELTRPGGSLELTFTEGNTPDFTYIHSSRVSLVSASNNQYWSGHKGEYALDGDPFTYWHSANSTYREISVTFDQEICFAGFTYSIEDSSKNGRFLSVDVYTSQDGKNWEKAESVTGWSWLAHPAANAPKTLRLETPVWTRYVKLTPVSTSGNFAAARDIGFYEDTERQSIATVDGRHFTTLEEAFGAAGESGNVELLQEDSAYLRQAISILAALPETAAPTLTIPAAGGTARVTLNKEAAQTVQRSAAGSGSIRLTVVNVTGTDPVQGAAATYQITMTQDGVPVFSAGNTTAGSTAAVSVPRPAGLEKPVVYHVAEDGTKTLLKSTATETDIQFITRHFSRFSIEEGAIPAADTEVTEYVCLDGTTLWLVTLPAQLPEGKVAAYGGSPMFFSEKYDAWCCLVIAKTLSQEDAAANIGIMSGTPVRMAKDTADINGTGLADASDAQLAYNMYNAYYDGFTASVTMEKFLRADVNCDGRLTTQDAAAIVSIILKHE